jgi:hypothetical protein
MFWNITIAVILAILAALVSGLAGQLAATKKWHKFLFWGTGVAMIALIGIQTYRNEKMQASLQAQLDTIQKNTETPPQIKFNPEIIVNVPKADTRQTSGGFVQLVGMPVFLNHGQIAAGVPISLNVYLAVRGTEPVYKVSKKFGISLMPVTASNAGEINKKMRTALRKYEHSKVTIPSLGVDNGVWATLSTDPLAQRDVEDIMGGTLRLYILGWSHWENALHDLEFCMWLQAPSTPQVEGTAVWHNCTD